MTSDFFHKNNTNVSKDIFTQYYNKNTRARATIMIFDKLN